MLISSHVSKYMLYGSCNTDRHSWRARHFCSLFRDDFYPCKMDPSKQTSPRIFIFIFTLLCWNSPVNQVDAVSNTPASCSISNPLGMENGAISDQAITQSTIFQGSSQYAGHKARLNNVGAWYAAAKDSSAWIQIKFPHRYTVTAIATQGHQGFVKEFTLNSSDDGYNWKTYSVGNVTKSFKGNADGTAIVNNTIDPPLVGKFIKLQVKQCDTYCALRMELYGCNNTNPAISPSACPSISQPQGSSLSCTASKALGSICTFSCKLFHVLVGKPVLLCQSNGTWNGTSPICHRLPDQPSSLQVSSYFSSSIMVSWNKPMDGSSSIIDYTVYWIADNQKAPKEKIVATTKAKLDVDPYTYYTIKVRARNAHGGSIWSASIRQRSDEAVPSMTPSNFIVKSDSSLSLTVQWGEIPPEGRHGVIAGYYIYFKNGSSQIVNQLVVNNSTFTHTLNNLMYTAYYVSVAGYTRMGHGPKASVIRAVPKGGAPTEPLNLKAEVNSSTAIFLSWSPPKNPNGKISKYTVKYGLKRDVLTGFVQTQGSELQLLIKSLEEFTTYYFLVYGETQMTGQSSTIVSAKTLEDAPSTVPKIDTLMARDAHTIFISWKKVPPKDCNGIILGYTIFYIIKGHSKFQNRTFNDESKLSTEITALTPYTEVCVKLAAFTKIGLSKNWDQQACTKVETLQTGPSSPVDVTLKAESSTSILVQWKAPTTPNGVIAEYLIYHGYKKENLENVDKVTGITYNKKIKGLRKYTSYYVQVRGKTTKPGNASIVKGLRTLEDAPSAPAEFKNKVMSPNSIILIWKDPKEINGVLRQYLIKVYEITTKKQVGNTITVSARSTSLSEYYHHVVFNLKPHREYNLTIQAVTIRPGDMAITTAVTEEGVPSAPTNVQVTLVDFSVNISWDPPTEQNGNMTMYKIYCFGSRSYDLNFSDQKHVEKKVKETKETINNLKPGTRYDVYVTAKTRKGEGTKSNPLITVYTNAEAPPAPKDPPDTVINSVTHNSISIILKPSPQTNGEVIAHQLIVETMGTVDKRNIDPLPKVVFDYKRAQEQGSRFYVAAEFRGANVPATFILGDGKYYEGFHNAPLKALTRYRVYVRGVTKDEDGKWIYGEPAAASLPATAAENSTLEKNNDQIIGIIVGIIGALIVIAIIVVAILLYKRSKRPLKANVDVENQKSKSKRRFRDLELKRLAGKKRPLSLPGEVTSDPEHPPIPMENFSKHVHKLHKSDDRGFMIEYNKLDVGRDFQCDNAYLADNKNKNRYGNIVAYDHSRVVLSVVDGKPCTDYINASHIDGYNKPSAYIATQGPVPHTFDDFWRMVWEQQSSTIVMLTNLQERHKLKCHKYWPDETEDYGDISVKQLKCEHYADYSIRTFNVKRESEKEEREVRQFHFIVWPDHGVPEYPTAILAFRRRERAYNPTDAGPVIVHCSAGVGRSGTFIVIDAMLDRIKAENSVDIFNYVAYLRSRRTAMVQTEEQYTFCHDAILEAIQCGNTQILAHDLRIALSKMEVVDKDNKMSRFEKEFKTLNKVSPVLPKACYIVATYPENKEKNRYQDILASDFSRVVLTAIDDNEITTYINAVHISGYKQQHAFITTQYPLTPTITDLWRMLCEQESACLVVFQPTEEGDFPQFWPEEGKQIYDEMITVECQVDKSNSVDNLRSTYDQSEITEYKFKLQDLRIPEKELNVKMFVLSGWANEDEPPDTSSMITLVAKVEKWQQQSGNGAITVMCSDGIGRSGTFCSLYSVLERVKIEQVVDVLQAIKAMRIPRPGLVKTTAEYRSIHFTVQEYLAAFDDYANFK